MHDSKDRHTLLPHGGDELELTVQYYNNLLTVALELFELLFVCYSTNTIDLCDILVVIEKLKLVEQVYNCETKELRLKLGENATFRCNVTIGHGDAQRSEVHVRWEKVRL